MSKPHRGRSIRELFARGRGECPVCKRKNVKILYEQDAGEQKFKICKTCRAAIKNGTKSLPVTASAKAAPAVVAATPAPEPKAAVAEAAETTAAETAEETTAAETA